MKSTTNTRLPAGLPLPNMAQTLIFWRRPLAYLEHCHRLYGPCFTLRPMGHPPLVFLSNHEEIKALIAAPPDCLHPGAGAAAITPIVGSTSFMIHDENRHLHGRKAILPSLHAKAIQQHTHSLQTIVRRHVASWPRDTTTALYPRLRALTLEIILERIFTADSLIIDGRLDALRERLLAMLTVTSSTILSVPLLRHDPRRGTWERFQHNRQAVNQLLYELIDTPRDPAAPTSDLHMVFLAARNPDGSPPTREQIRDNIMSILLAGHETTASQLAWAFQLLAHNPRVLARLTEEIDHGESDEYLTATIQETLRHRPVFLFTIPRAVARPIEIGGWRYRPPTRLLGCIYLVHHDPRIYPDPQAFRPERFLDRPPQPHLWLPWGGGRRRCPGLHMTMLEMKTVLRSVLSGATVLPAARRMERPLWRSVIVTPHAGSRVVLSERIVTTSC